MEKSGCVAGLIYLAISVLLLVGEVKCVIKMINCNWDPVGKAEVLYTLGTFTGLGSIIGWIDIEDK